MTTENTNSEAMEEEKTHEPSVINTETPLTQQLEEGIEQPELVEGKKKPSVITFILIVGLVFGLAIGACYFAWIAYQDYQASTSSEPVISLTGNTALEPVAGIEDVPSSTQTETPPTELDEAPAVSDYKIEEPERTESFSQVTPEVKHLPSSQTPQVTLESLNGKIEQLTMLVNGLVEGQRAAIDQGSNILKSAEDSAILSDLINRNVTKVIKEQQDAREDREAIIVGQETLSKKLGKVGSSAKKSSNSFQPVAPQKSTRVSRNEPLPPFRLSTPSIWGDTVTFMVEIDGGFYKSAQKGESISGWKLVSFDMSAKSTSWEKNGVIHELSFN